MRYSFLWSLWNMSGAIMKQHIVVQTPPILPQPLSIVEQALPMDPHFHDRRLIRFTNDKSSMIKVQRGMTIVPISSIYYSRENYFPAYHSFSRGHYMQFCDSFYASIMEYMEFCKMEDKLSHIINQYLEDKKNHWLIMMDDPFLMGSVRGYGTRSAIVGQTTWITMADRKWNDMLLVDMDTENPHL